MDKNNQERAPLAEAINAYAESGALAFHTPGHKQGLGAADGLKKLITPQGLRAEVSVSGAVDEPYQPEGCVKEAVDLAAALFGADKTLFMVNGTTGGIHTMLLSVLKPGDKVLLPRNSHRSVLGGLILSGARPVYIQPKYDARLEIMLGLEADAVKQAVADNRDAKALIAVYPTYYGVASPLKEIAEIVHAAGLLLLVDEAHGAHLSFSKELPPSALSCGADMVAQSTHKLLGSLTQTSMLHIKTAMVDYEKVERAAMLLGSTSPNYLLLASLDIARQQMAIEGKKRIEKVLQLARKIRTAVNEINGLWCPDANYFGGTGWLDELKITVQVSGLGISGHEADMYLQKNQMVRCELADAKNILFIISMADNETVANKLIEALRHLTAGYEKKDLPDNGDVEELALPEVVLSPQEAFLAGKEAIELEKAAGRISAEEIVFYPPGIPVVCPGERLNKQIIAYMKKMKTAGLNVTGCRDTSLSMIDVITK